MTDETRYFQCITQEQDMMGVNAPSGLAYVSKKGEFFPVQNKDDIEFFLQNKRYREKGFIESVKPKPVKDDSRSLFEKELSKIKELSKSDIKLVLDTYESKQNLIDELKLGRPLPVDLKKKAQDALKKVYK